MDPCFYLIVPDLFLSVRLARETGVPPPCLDCLDTLTGRAEVSRIPDTMTTIISRFLPRESLPGGEPPAGPVSYLGDMGSRPGGWCYRADPVSLEAHTDHLRLLHSQSIAPELDEAQALIEAFNAAYEGDGLSLRASHPSRWYLLTRAGLDAETSDPATVVGRNIIDFMPSGPDGPRLKTLMTEVQMIFYQHEVNTRREQRGMPLINSIWLWGGGQLPRLESCVLPAAWGDDPYLKGLWTLCDEHCAALPDDATACLAGMTAHGGAAVVDGAARSWFAGGADVWRRQLQDLDKRWCQPVLSALKDGRINDARIMTNGMEFALSRRSLRRFWRRPKPLTAWCP